MANFFAEYGGKLTSATSGIPTGWGQALSQGFGYLTEKETAKQAAKQAQRDFELAKIRAQAEASRPSTMPGAPSQVEGGTGLAPAIPTWALVGAGAALLLVILATRR